MKNDYKSYIEVIPMSVNLCLEETSHPSKHAYTYIFLIDQDSKVHTKKKLIVVIIHRLTAKALEAGKRVFGKYGFE